MASDDAATPASTPTPTTVQAATDGGHENRLWYTTTPDEWVEALPVGGGRLGAMVFGYPGEERLQLNEETLWAGSGRNDPGGTATEHLDEVRELLLAGEHERAHEVADEHLMGEPRRLRPYQSLGTLSVRFAGHGDAVAIDDASDPTDAVTDYTRELDLATGVATTSYEVDGTSYERECFASHVDDVVVYRVTAGEAGAITARVGIDRQQDARSAAVGDDVGPDVPELVLRGQVLNLPEDEHGAGDWGLRFEGRVRARIDDGSLAVDEDADELVVEDANALTLLVAARTSFDGGEPTAETRADLDAVSDKSVTDLRADHVADHRSYFDRVSFDLGGGDATPSRGDHPAERPTDERLAAVADGDSDPGLAALYFQYARYLLISSSRPGGLPATLQGIWCGDMDPAWNSGFTTNLNVEMNYWSAEVANLADCHEPLLELIDSLRPSGRETAREHYDCEGWCVHHNTDLWRSTTPVDGVWGLWPMATAWLCRHLWEHYAYSRDETYLAEQGYPVMKEAAAFALDYLIEDDAGELVTAPSVSPENIFVGPDGFEGWLCVSPAVDVELLTELFGNVIAASEVLDRDPAFRERLEAARAKLPALQVGSDGRLLEWRAEYDEHYPGHRHLSHLYAAYPGDLITPADTPELADAVAASLEHRLEHGSGSTGWSQAWLVNQYARLGDAEAAHGHVTELLGEYTADSMLDLHPPFQIDGNFGGAAGIAELLLQSHEGEVALLPALPEAWPAGDVSGLRARGGFEIDLSWSGGTPDAATVRSTAGEECRVRVPGSAAAVSVAVADAAGGVDDAGASDADPTTDASDADPTTGETVEVARPADDLLVFDTAAGTSYELAW